MIPSLPAIRRQARCFSCKTRNERLRTRAFSLWYKASGREEISAKSKMQLATRGGAWYIY